ncbi:hypothetical protein RJT34_28435 [Clitoria ternatea]|uniref:Uncharacterized protein n=1 Tax=Clitoria ternatea TaxID=43366 RepID=A0AAN9FB63_CLITE
MDKTNITQSCFDESDSDYSASVLGYIDQMLMEEDTEEKYTMFQGSVALQDTERSFYEVIGENYPSSSYSIHHNLHNHPTVESPEQSLSSDYSTFSSGSGCSTASTSNSPESQWSPTSVEYNYNPPSPILPTNFPVPSSSNSSGFGFMGNSMPGGFLDSIWLRNSEYLLQFERGIEQGAGFLPTQHGPFIVNQDCTTFSPSFIMAPQVVIKTETESLDYEGENFVAVNKEPDEANAKLQDGYVDESELSELFDKVLLGTGLGKGAPPNTNDESNSCISGVGKSLAQKQYNDEQVVDLRTLLMLCAQAIASDDRSLANQLVKQIKQHSSPMGDGTQRLAHYFGNSLEARLNGTGFQLYRALSSKRISAAEMVKAYRMYASVCPFEKLAITFTNNSIWNLAKEAETLHIIDFGVGYGFKWPALIDRISKREGGPPKLRITGIEMPQLGFNPEERMHEAGRRLASYCKRFNVPFEFIAVAKRWETIRVEDLKIENNEFVAVNCLSRFDHLFDETVTLNNPRDAVLNLIKGAKPDIFVHVIVNGGYDAPFFVTRFREALYHYSALFDMLDSTNVDRGDPMRLMFENDMFGREVMNVIACEGVERVERSTTYRQWQLRKIRIGFRQLPLDQQIINKLKGALRDGNYNTNFMLEVDGNWVLQGWKGRILQASSCWATA